jgi:hypothetical protein
VTIVTQEFVNKYFRDEHGIGRGVEIGADDGLARE